MPMFRNLRQNQGRHSGRLENRVPVAYDHEGWEVPLGQDTLQDLCLARGNGSQNHTQRRSAPPSNESHSWARSSDLDNDYPFSQETVALASNGNSLHSRSRSDSAVSASSSTMPPTAPSPPPSARKSSAKHQSKPYSRNTGDKVPRPRNAFIVFRSHFNMLPPPPKEGNGKTNQNEISKMAAKVWKSMTEEQQAPYKAEALEEKERHHRLYPNYRYTPGSKKMPAAPATKVAGRRRARKIAAEYTDSEDEGSDMYCELVEAATAARHLRPRSARRYSIPSPSPSVRSISPTPSGTHCASSPDSISEAQTDSEFEFVATEDIPHLALSPVVEEKKEEFPEFSPDDLSLFASVLSNDTDAVFGVKPYAMAGVVNMFLPEYELAEQMEAYPTFTLHLPLPATPPASPLDLSRFETDADMFSIGGLFDEPATPESKSFCYESFVQEYCDFSDSFNMQDPLDVEQ